MTGTETREEDAGPITTIEQLMLHNAWGHMYRVTGAHLLLPDLATFGLPLDDPAPAEYEIDLLKIAGVFTSIWEKRLSVIATTPPAPRAGPCVKQLV